MKDDRFPKIILVSQLSRAKQKAGCIQMGREDVGKDQREMEIFWDAVKRMALNRLGWRRSVCHCAGLRQLGAAGSC